MPNPAAVWADHFEDEKDVTRAVAELSQKAIGGKVYVIADEVVRGHMYVLLQVICLL